MELSLAVNASLVALSKFGKSNFIFHNNISYYLYQPYSAPSRSVSRPLVALIFVASTKRELLQQRI
jgi:hypothetical protein